RPSPLVNVQTTTPDPQTAIKPALASSNGHDGPPDVVRPTHRPGLRRSRIAAVALFLAAIVVLRLVALTSDPYRRLDWCTGLMTDEGYYAHNARNVALFGHARTDEFNNMLVSPLLHAVQ